MAFPKCPNCALPVPLYDRAVEIRPAEVEVFRSYRCTCGWAALTIERVYCVDPETLRLRGKYCQPAVTTVSTEGR
jgi:hypothetical protein